MSAFLALFAAFAAVIYIFFKRRFGYWQRNNVQGPTPTIPMGNFGSVFTKKGLFQYLAEFYSEYKSKGYKYIGVYLLSRPVFVPIELELTKAILIKDHHHFVDRGMYVNEEGDPLSNHLFNMEGKKWRTMRAKLSPTFTSGKMKIMFPILLEVGCQMEKGLLRMADKNEPLDIKEILARYSTDIIGSCAFGIDCNSFVNPNSEFRKYGKEVFNTSFLGNLKFLTIFISQDLAKLLHLRFQSKKLTQFFLGIVKDNISYREENNVDRNDFLKLLIELKNGNSELGTLTLEEIAAQAFIFFAAGFETSSTTMTFCLLELSNNQDIQQKVRKEINEVLKKHDGKLSYEAIKDMKYLQAVVDETLRMYPPVPILNRICTLDYNIPGTDVTIKKNTLLMLPTFGMHYDPELFPNPEKFDPSRFYDNMKAYILQCSFLPFGEGPRNCIGLRFGLMQTKVGLSIILKNFKISLHEKTKLPIELDPHAFTLTTIDKMYLNAEKIY